MTIRANEPLERYEVDYRPDPALLGEWAIVDTTTDLVVGRDVSLVGAARRADARNAEPRNLAA